MNNWTPRVGDTGKTNSGEDYEIVADDGTAIPFCARIGGTYRWFLPDLSCCVGGRGGEYLLPPAAAPGQSEIDSAPAEKICRQSIRRGLAADFLAALIAKAPYETLLRNEAEEMYRIRALGAVGYADALLDALDE